MGSFSDARATSGDATVDQVMQQGPNPMWSKRESMNCREPRLTGESRKSMAIGCSRILGLLVAGLVLVSGCAAAPGPTPSSSGGGDSTGASGTSSAPSRDLGVEPVPEAYRALDLCAMVDLTALRESAGAGAPAVSVEPSAPGKCDFSTDKGASILVAVGPPRSALPTAVLAPTPVSEDVESNAEGEVILNKGCSDGYVVADGFVIAIRVAPSPAPSGHCALLRGIAQQVRSALAKGAPTLPPGVGSSDVCAAMEKSPLSKLDGATVAPVTADRRTCAIFVGKDFIFDNIVASKLPHGVKSTQVGTVEMAQWDDGCLVSGHVQGAGAAPGWWQIMRHRPKYGGGSCRDSLRARQDLVRQLIQSP